MTDNPRLAAALRWWDTLRPHKDLRSLLTGMLAAIDADDPMRQPVTEEEAREARRVYLNMSSPDGMALAISAFLAARGAAVGKPDPTCKPALQVGVVTGDVVERGGTNAGRAGGVVTERRCGTCRWWGDGTIVEYAMDHERCDWPRPHWMARWRGPSNAGKNCPAWAAKETNDGG
jgi:hypothetical protein